MHLSLRTAIKQNDSPGTWGVQLAEETINKDAHSGDRWKHRRDNETISLSHWSPLLDYDAHIRAKGYQQIVFCLWHIQRFQLTFVKLYIHNGDLIEFSDFASSNECLVANDYQFESTWPAFYSEARKSLSWRMCLDAVRNELLPKFAQIFNADGRPCDSMLSTEAILCSTRNTQQLLQLANALLFHVFVRQDKLLKSRTEIAKHEARLANNPSRKIQGVILIDIAVSIFEEGTETSSTKHSAPRWNEFSRITSALIRKCQWWRQIGGCGISHYKGTSSSTQIYTSIDSGAE